MSDRPLDNAKPIATPMQLLHWRVGPLFALGNLALIPCFSWLIGMSLGRAFAKGPPDPWRDFWIAALGWLSLLLFSCLPPQALLVTVCFTWSPGNFWRRFVQHFFVVSFIVGTYFGGIVLMIVPQVLEWLRNSNGQFHLGWGDPEQRRQQMLGFSALLCSLPILLLAVQLPFWLARHLCGCRLIHASAVEQPDSSLDSLALRDLFVATALVAVSIAMLQFSDRVNVEQGRRVEHDHLFWVLILAASCSGVSLVVGLPFTLAWLTVRNLWLAWGITLAGEGVVLLACGAITTYFYPAWEGAMTIPVMAYVFSISAGIGFTVLRRYGWRLATHWSELRG